MPDDDVQFKSPKTGKVQVVPPEQWEDALSRGYTPTTHKIMYSPDGKRGMVPNGELKDYMKQGFETTTKTQLEQKVTGTGELTKGAGTAFVDTLKGMMPPAPEGSVFSKKFWLGDNTVGIHPTQSGIAQVGKEAQAEYQRARAAGVNPVAAGFSGGVAGAGSLAGVSNIRQMQQAEHGESGQILGESAAPAAAAVVGTAVAPYAGRFLEGLPRTTPPKAGGLSPEVTGAAGRHIGEMIGIPGAAYIGEKIGRRFGTPGTMAGETAESFSKQQRSAAYEEMNKDFAKKTAAKAKADAAAAKAAEKLAKNAPPPDPFAGATSTAAPIGSAELPPVPQGQPTPFPAVTRKGGMAPPPSPETAPPTGGPLDITQPKTSLLSRGRTVVQPGMEPDLSNPAHVKMINDYQTMSGANLRGLASAGDRFAAFVLRHMPRP